MTFEEVRRQWQDAVNRPLAEVEKQALLSAAQQRCTRLERGIFRRDVSEIVAAMVTIVAFAAAWPIYRFSLVATLGVAIIILAAPAIIYTFLSARHVPPPPFDASVADYARQRLVWLDRQIRLLETIGWWYIAPLATGCMLMTWGLTPNRWYAFCQMTVLMIVATVWTVWWNRRTVRNELLPARREVTQVIAALEPTPPAAGDDPGQA